MNKLAYDKFTSRLKESGWDWIATDIEPFGVFDAIHTQNCNITSFKIHTRLNIDKVNMDVICAYVKGLLEGITPDSWGVVNNGTMILGRINGVQPFVCATQNTEAK